MTCQLLVGDALTTLRSLPAASVQCCVTSPPYFGLRSYLPEDHPTKALEMGREQAPAEFIARLVAVFREVRRVLKPSGVVWINIADSFASHGRMVNDIQASKQSLKAYKNGPSVGRVVGFKDKDLLGIPWRMAFALQDDGWWLRQDCIWSKPNPMPSSVLDRCTLSHEYLFMFTKSKRYYYNSLAIAEDVVKGAAGSDFHTGKTGTNGLGRVSTARRGESETRNKRSVWTIPTEGFSGSHYAVMPTKLVEPCILAGSREGDTVLDPFFGSGTVAKVALSHGRSFIGIDLDARNVEQARHRIGPMLLDEQTATTPIRRVKGAAG